MPTYEYECKTCGNVFDLFQPITAEPLQRHRCETCGRVRPVKRLLGTGGALIFKGSGFYITDYRSESFKKAAKADSEAASPKAETAKSDKPAAAGKPAPAKPAKAKGAS